MTTASNAHARETARELLEIMPLVMRAVAAELRSGGEMPAPAHFGLLMKLREQPRTLTELATHWGVSLPTTSNSISALAERGWVRRAAPGKDRRVAVIEVTPAGRAALERVGRAAEAHLAEALLTLDRTSQRRLRAGLAVLRNVFAKSPTAGGRRPRSARGRD
jgi:DNA-binding MarR family transcriptional regulator